MARKTFRLADFVDAANRMLAAPGGTTEGRVAIAVLVDHVLMEADAYAGYGYLPSEYLPSIEQADDNVLRPDYDESRRRYYLKGK